jgi:hypothetical protein
MPKYEEQCNANDLSKSIRICQPPCDRGKEKEKGEEVGKRRIGSMPCVFRLFLYIEVSLSTRCGGTTVYHDCDLHDSI